MYHGANILLLNNDWQTFISIVFYKGQFYSWQTDAVKVSEYNNKEFLLAVDNAYTAAKEIVDEVRQRSLTKNKIKKICQNFLRILRGQKAITK